MIEVIAVYLDDKAKAHVLGPTVTTDVTAVHRLVLESLSRPEHATWSFVVALDMANILRAVADRDSLTWFAQLPQEVAALKRLLLEQELAALDTSRAH